ncbi:hypothetical protein PYW08_006846 [Mythimna loreyi]|uniref:Uncharacterized protein n=4 Tax=Mythimna loreyi TaxID=667449 RepID=A0ACC2QQ12_9NEOP|nr:hypothetical protein PYW08_006546 [Mythimna loreyi]KAJ8726824.1 hypothetical protein PYW08_015221 [Mythimna loreyi]KAJ8730857.1 hypothetical protein PYW08_002270 [Mythimna loreyi]KAJ8736190.1 hypothetical protein PYW08_006846 [Mythimna loreyi]
MEKNENTVPLYEQLFEKRRRLSKVREKVIQARGGKPFGDIENKLPHEEEGTKNTACVSKKSNIAHDIDMNDGEEDIFDYGSDDSVKDKDYEPDIENDSSCSEISDSAQFRLLKMSQDQVKRRLFPPDNYCPEACKHEPCNAPVSIHLSSQNKNTTNYQGNAENTSDLITVEDLIGPQNLSSKNIDSVPDFDQCAYSPLKKKTCLERPEIHINETGELSDDSDTPCTDKTIFLPSKQEGSKALVCYKKIDKNVTMSPTLTPDHYPIMVVDLNGVVYLNQVQGLSETQNVKKKIADPTKWKRNSTKIARLKGSPYHSTVAKKKPDVEGRMLKPPCSCKAKCYTKISHEKRELIFNQFWKNCRNWDQRRQFIVSNVKKDRKRNMKTSGDLELDRRKFSYNYSFTVDGSKEKVCKVMFLNTLSIGEKFVKLSVEKKMEGGLTIEDQRGKHVPGNKSPAPIINKVMDHINSYPSYESHYSRQKSGKKYLGPDLNIATMYQHYKELMIKEGTPNNLVAKEWLYRNIFNTKFNLSFKLPSVDTCDDCDAYERKFKDAIEETEKKEIEKEHKLHQDAANERYNLKKIDKEEAQNSSGKKRVLMFDLQKCLATPNLTNTKSFYLRKLWTLNLTIYDATSNVASNVIWSENIGGRGGNEVASCLIRWAEENRAKLGNVEELLFWSDNCAGQNRNLMIVMAYIWLLHKFPNIKIINHKFMLKGHTHMEVDQIHSQIERRKKQLKTMQIAIPRDWSQFIRTCGGKKTFEVFDMELQHFKDLTSLYKKNGPLVMRKKNKDGQEFKISECVWLQLKQEQPGTLFYKTNFSAQFSEISLVRNLSKGIQFPSDLPNVREEAKPISSAKYKDLITLLEWVPAEFHDYYRNLKHDANEPDFPETD